MIKSIVLLILIPALVPVFAVLFFVYSKDRFAREPFKQVAKIFLISAIVAPISIPLERIAMAIFYTNYKPSSIFDLDFKDNLLCVALVEEGVKWLVLMILAWNKKVFKYRYDGIVYAVIVSLGFATLENVLYVINYMSLQVALVRGIMSVPLHCTCGVFMGYFYGMARHNLGNGDTGRSALNRALALIVPLFIHGLYDFALSVESDYVSLAGLGFTVVVFIFLYVPMLVLALLAVVFMLGTGGFFAGASLLDALQEADSTLALVYAGVGTLVFVFALYIPRGLMTPDQFGDAFMEGLKDMIDAMAMLLLAWTVSRVMGDDVLATGPYVASMVPADTPALLLPLVMFVVTGAIAFTTGVSWGAMAIMVPPSIAICATVAPEMISMSLGGVFAGVIFGDHCSPLSDTTILSSTGAGCDHIDHVRSQLPYALTSGAVACVTFVVAGATRNPWVSLGFGLCAMTLTAYCLHRYSDAQEAAYQRKRGPGQKGGPSG